VYDGVRDEFIYIYLFIYLYICIYACSGRLSTLHDADAKSAAGVYVRVRTTAGNRGQPDRYVSRHDAIVERNGIMDVTRNR